MIVEQLISAYLDGDLTPEQDQLLRAQISANPAAREAFDAAVLLHISMCCEDATEVPSDLRKCVFGAIDASTYRTSSSEFQKIVTRAVKKVSMMTVMLMLLCLPITDRYLESKALRDRANLSDVNDITLNKGYRANLASGTRSTGHKGATKPGSGRRLADFVTGVDKDVEVPQADNKIATVPDADQSVEKPTIELPSLNSFFSQPISVVSLIEGQETITPSSQQGGVAQRTPITLSSVYATGLSSGTSGATDITQFAASIGYEMSGEDFVGLEIGTTSYSIQQTATSLRGEPEGASLTTQEASDASIPSQTAIVQAPLGPPTKLASPDQTTEHYLTSQFITLTKQSTAWGAAFYERRIITMSSLSLNARAAAGVGEDGVIGYGRIIGEWKIDGVVSLVIGSELRTMPFKIGNGIGIGTGTGIGIGIGTGTNTRSSINYNTILTGLTGVRVRF